ncbi:MAG: hypothetical protein R6V85_13050, partial [Polyangia bacterium]
MRIELKSLFILELALTFLDGLLFSQCALGSQTGTAGFVRPFRPGIVRDSARRAAPPAAFPTMIARKDAAVRRASAFRLACALRPCLG